MKKIKLTMVSVLVLLLVSTLVLEGENSRAKSKSNAFEITSDVLYDTKGKSASANFTLLASAGPRSVLVCAQFGVKKEIHVDKDVTPLDLEGSESTPQHFSLSQNYPNPFNPQTSIRYALPQDAHVKLIVYNLLGQKVKTLVDEHQSAGHKTVWWDGKDESGGAVASGAYFYRIDADEFSKVKKMMLVK
jgi:hypothetical protein